MNSLPVQRPTAAKISLANLAFNFHSVKAFIGEGVEAMAVVKADAYGHGSVECSRRLEAEGANWLAVATVEEGFELREAGISAAILILGGFWPGQENSLLDRNLTPVVFRIDQVCSLAEAARNRQSVARIHIKIDTGMGRIGVRPDDLVSFAADTAATPGVEVEGLMTHFAAADDLEATGFTNRQIAVFTEAVEIFQSHGHRPLYIDLANSPGTVVHPLSRSKMVRIGGLLYGLGGDVLPTGVPHPDLKPVMSLTSKIAQIKTIRSGETVGYGRTFVASRDTVVATVPIGYHDGLPRSLSNTGHLLVGGQRAPIIGRVSMDWTTIDVTEIPEAEVCGDVTIIGAAGNEMIRAENVAALANTISYEITCGISGRVPRRYESL